MKKKINQKKISSKINNINGNLFLIFGIIIL